MFLFRLHQHFFLRHTYELFIELRLCGSVKYFVVAVVVDKLFSQNVQNGCSCNNYCRDLGVTHSYFLIGTKSTLNILMRFDFIILNFTCGDEVKYLRA